MTPLSVQRVRVLLAVRELEPDGYGEALRTYLMARGAGIARAQLYRQLDALKEAGYVRVARRDGPRQYLATTAAGRAALHRWVTVLCRLANV